MIFYYAMATIHSTDDFVGTTQASAIPVSGIETATDGVCARGACFLVELIRLQCAYFQQAIPFTIS